MEALRRMTIVVALSAAASAPVSPAIEKAHAQAYPSRPITLVVPFAAGGGIDIVARIFAEKLQANLHQPITVENRAGAGGAIGTSYVAGAAPHGYTLLFIEASSVLAKLLHKKMQFDVIKDFTPVAMVVTNYLGLFANVSLPVDDIKQLIAYGKANPGKLSVGTPGNGTPHHLAALMFNRAVGVEITHVPYRGTPPSVNDLIGGQIPLVWAVPISVLPYLQQAKVKALGVSASHRLALLPQVPTIAETVPGFEITLWLGIAAPAGTTNEVVSRLANAVGEITQSPDVRKRISALGYTVDFRKGADFHEVLIADQAKYRELVDQAGIEAQ